MEENRRPRRLKPRRKLTAKFIENAKPMRNARAEPERTEYADAACGGLYCVVHPTGKTGWAVRYRRKSDGRSRCLTLPWEASLQTARQLARAALDRVALGHDPAAEKQAARRAAVDRSDDVETVLRTFLIQHRSTRSGKPIRQSTKLETARLLGFKRVDNEWQPSGSGVLQRWRGRKISSITRRDIHTLIQERAETHPIVSNRLHANITTLFNFLARDHAELLPSGNPCTGIRRPAPETSRERVLSDAEIRALWTVAEREPLFGPGVQLLALSGCRRAEVFEASWNEFDIDHRKWLIPAARCKNGRAHLVHLTPTMLRILENLPRTGNFLFSANGREPFSGFYKATTRLREAMAKELGTEPERWSLHDLRRSFVTNLQRLRVPIETIEAAVNHVSGRISGVTATYARHTLEDERREALELWDRHLVRLVEGTPPGSTVVELRRAAAG